MNAPFFISKICAHFPFPAWQKDASLHYIWANAGWSDFSKNKSEQWLGGTDFDFFDKEIAQKIEDGDRYCLQAGISDEEISLTNSKGQERILKIHRMHYYDESNNLSGISALAIDITYNKVLLRQMENIISEVEIQRHALHKNALITITRQDGSFIYASEPFCLLSGYTQSELLQTNRFDIGLIYSAESLKSIQAILPYETLRFETCAKSKNGEEYWLETLLVPMITETEKNYYEISCNITASKLREKLLENEVKDRILEANTNTLALEKRNADLIRLNEQMNNMQHKLLQSEKLASIGQLAAGIAHEINNPIGYVGSNISALDGYLKEIFTMQSKYESSLEKKSIEYITLAEEKKSIDYDFIKNDISSLIMESREGIKRVKGIVQNLKEFSRIDSNQIWEEADIHAGITSTLNIVQNEIKYKSEVILDYGELPLIKCVISQLNQVFLNILVNASHAIEKQGKIFISTRQQNQQICISFRDNGKGIAAEHLSKIFDPFFTTKPVGQGTGLGLSLSYGIIQEHHGRIDVHSKQGEGTTFDIWLPIQQE
ncbi:PAS domain S-box protein [Iodobacter sp. HSC-16F04]|uniref:histidine kinase n=1 Tax=Iodobacter violaceini TaxID=3044271 RepID=A0ABX0KRX9_9NEIS|nr:ATP-binding protein [Iodobacter violacea]NHQ87386.1 PAS domain S-box protein [Iodobacter violacea]